MRRPVRHDAVCPICATPRTGAFRFCLGCRFDFDADGGPGPPRRLGIGRGGAGRHRTWSSRRIVVVDGAFELSPWTVLVLILTIAGLASLLVVLLGR